MLVSADQLVMGAGVALLSLVGLRHEAWLLDESRGVQWVRGQFGDRFAVNGLRAVLLGGVTFGTLLAAGVVNPMNRPAAGPVAADAR